MTEPDIFVPRNITQLIDERLRGFAIVYIEGPRQAGKTTLVRSLARERKFDYLSLDDTGTRNRIDADPSGFVAGLGHAVIDEVQERPDLLRQLKLAVDQRGGYGHFILTGSASIKAQRKVVDLPVGRMCILKLLPLSQAELHRAQTNFLAAAFASETEWNVSAPGAEQLHDAIVRGGYPKLQAFQTRRQRSAWMRHYLATLSEHDIPHLRDQKERIALRELLTVLAGASGGRLSIGQVAKKFGMKYDTISRYVELVQDLYLVRLLPAFDPARNRFVQSKQRKLAFNDSGFLAGLLGVAEDRKDMFDKYAGPLFETFVCGEIAKQCNEHDSGHELGYWAHKKDEVDLVVEHGGRFVGIEVRHTAVPQPDDCAGLLRMAAQLGERMVRGIVLCRCRHAINFAKLRSRTQVPMQAVPVSALWAKKPQGTLQGALF